MGAHSIGGAHKENSGYKGTWTPTDQRVFDERYYYNMINRTNTWENIVS
jgi:hypothetical protein